MNEKNQELSKPYSPEETEDKIYKLWEKSGAFSYERLKEFPISNFQFPNKSQIPNSKIKKTKPYTLNPKPFSIVLPPPNITGSLHMGHALNTVIQDILIRKKRMEGFQALWVPGTDHAGIATQNVVEKELKKEGLTRFDLGREKFLERIWEWREKYGDRILKQLKTLGASCDWPRTRFTMDKDYQKTVQEAFIHYYKKGLIYQTERVINWCPRCETSLSDLELEYKEERGKLWFIKYKIKSQSSKLKTTTQNSKLIKEKIDNYRLPTTDYITVATTRPETMLGDSAVAVNPKDERYKNLVGQTVILPLVNREIPIISDKQIDLNFGTGAVKVTPAHDMLDAEIGKTHNLPIYKVIGEKGQIIGAEEYKDLNIFEARAKIVKDLEKQNLIEKIEDYTHNIVVCYRCGKTIEILPSLQWFLKMDELAKKALKAVKSGKIKFHPKRWEKIYFEWLKNVKDWCVSRQIWWGHRMPVWYCISCSDTDKIEFENYTDEYGYRQLTKPKNILSKKKYQPIVSIKEPNECPRCRKKNMIQDADVLDTWFSSALWPFAVFNKKNDLQKFYPTNTLVTARDIINLWVSRMVFSGLEFMKKEPFQDVIIHATILTKEGKRMSKSLGTGIDPMDLIEQYGADATRFAIVWQVMGNQDIHWSEESLIAGKKFLNKIWNAARFVLTQNGQLQTTNCQLPTLKLTKEDKKILKELESIIKITNTHIEKYEFGQALHKLYDFFWHDFCDKYLEISKIQMQNPEFQKNTQQILLHILITSLKLLHPFMPFATEHIWSFLPKKNAKQLLIIEPWPYKK